MSTCNFSFRRFDTPQMTWERMIAALWRGDVDGALESVHPSERKLQRQIMNALAIPPRAPKPPNMPKLTLTTSGVDGAQGTFQLYSSRTLHAGFGKLFGRWYLSLSAYR